MTLLDRHLLFVGGKGGTGKSTIAAALARLAAAQGQNVLLISADGSPGAAGMFGVRPGFDATEVEVGLHVLQIERTASLDEFVRVQLGPLGVVAGPVASAFSFVADAAPGVGELLLIGKCTHEARTGDWDLVVVDSASSGHLLGELAAPANVAEIAPIGRIAKETSWMIDMLGDPAFTAVINVTLAEDVPVSETLDFVDALHDRTPARLGAVVVNRTRPQLYARSTRESVDGLIADPPARLTKAGSRLLDAVELGLARADIASAIDRRLRSSLPAEADLLHVPEFGVVDDTVSEVELALGDELSVGNGAPS